jgi:dihydrofolate reductase
MGLIVIEFLTLDGVMQDPDGAEATTHGGWAFRRGPAAVAGDKFRLGPLLDTGTLLFGRRTWEHFAQIWPSRTDDFAAKLNAMPKLIASTTRDGFDDWSNSSLLKGDSIAEIGRLKQTRDLVLLGSSTLAHQVITHRLVDEYRLLVFPCIVGEGVRLFEHSLPADLDLIAVEQKDAAVLLTYRPTSGEQA